MKALQEGTYSRHFQDGSGVITASGAEHASLDFDLHGLKKFVARITVVDLAEETPSTRSKRPKKAPRAGRTAGAK